MAKKHQREYRDRLFKAIFGRNTEKSKRWRLELYNALNGTSYTDPNALELNTIENVIYMTMKNDVSFLVDSQMTLYEQQSTPNPNIPLRGMMYFAKLYQKHLTKERLNLLSTQLVKIPSPQFIVFYNGSKEKPDRYKLPLSDAFIRENKTGDFEWTATIININQNHNTSLQKNCKALYHYVQYVSRVVANTRNGMENKDAVEEAVEWAIAGELLDGYFKEQRAEVMAMSLTEFDLEDSIRTWRNDGIAEGIEIGRSEGKEEKAIEDARSFYANGASIELIAKSLGMTIEQVKAIVTSEVLENA
ncbi:MAG: hypothetical protein J5647_02780 [Spirochaetaceae bacterium]|nr:hypothetical protein [Spirochaetaceae bacterium]